MSEDGARPHGGRVVDEAGLDGCEGVRAVFVPPPRELPPPPLPQVGVGHPGEDALAEEIVCDEGEPVDDGELLVGRRSGVRIRLVEGLDGLLEDGLHARPPLLPEPPRDPHHRVGRAIAVGEDAGVQQVDAHRAPRVGEVDEADVGDEGFGHVLQQGVDEVGVGVDDDDGVAVASCGLLPQPVGHDVVHEGGLAHLGACDVEVVAAGVAGEVDGPGPAHGGLAHGHAGAEAPGGGHERPCARAVHEGRVVAGGRGMPEGRGLADADDAAPAEQSQRGGREGGIQDRRGLYLADGEAGAGGVVVVAVGGGDRPEQLPGAALRVLRSHGGQDGGDLYLGVVGDAGDLLLDEGGRVGEPGLTREPPSEAIPGDGAVVMS